jgi:propanediol utilization protein
MIGKEIECFTRKVVSPAGEIVEVSARGVVVAENTYEEMFGERKTISVKIIDNGAEIYGHNAGDTVEINV